MRAMDEALRLALRAKWRILPGQPTSEIHLHIGNAFSRELIAEMQANGECDLPADFLTNKEHRYYPDLAHHHQVYEKLRATVGYKYLYRTVHDHLTFIARNDNAVYAELSFSYREPKSFEQNIEIVESAMHAAKKETGIESRVLVTVLRDHGSDNAEKAVKFLEGYRRRNPKTLITGFGMAGQENLDDFRDYKRSLQWAWDAGLGIAPHVAEQYIGNAKGFLESLPIGYDRIKETDPRRVRAGHATLIHMSTDLMKEFRDKGIMIEVCLKSNGAIDLPDYTKRMRKGMVVDGIKLDRDLARYFRDLSKHPEPIFAAHGLVMGYGSDNPAMVASSVGKDASNRKKHELASDQEIHERLRNNVKYGNMDFETRVAGLKNFDDFEAKTWGTQQPMARIA